MIRPERTSSLLLWLLYEVLCEHDPASKAENLYQHVVCEPGPCGPEEYLDVIESVLASGTSIVAALPVPAAAGEAQLRLTLERIRSLILQDHHADPARPYWARWSGRPTQTSRLSERTRTLVGAILRHARHTTHPSLELTQWRAKTILTSDPIWVERGATPAQYLSAIDEALASAERLWPLGTLQRDDEEEARDYLRALRNRLIELQGPTRQAPWDADQH